MTDGYRSELDGLRALAVLAVILHHFEAALLPSGYLGVDIFFVLSGYVITGSLIRRPASTFRSFIAGFYARRVKRLVPALALFVVATSLFISLFDPNPTASLATGRAALLGISNIELLRVALDYFGISAELNAFTHTWSLGVEEQFYLVYPLILSLVVLRKGGGIRNWGVHLLEIGAVASLVSFVWTSSISHPTAYFLSPYRFWELAAGCIVRLREDLPRQYLLAGMRRLGTWAPLILLTGVLFAPRDQGTLATAIAVVTTSVLLANQTDSAGSFKVLRHPIASYFGRVSYSLYLWHWTVLCIARWTIGLHWWLLPVLFGLMLGLAHASYRLVEQPLRRATWSRSDGRTAIMGLSLLLALFGLGTLTEAHAATLYSGSAPAVVVEAPSPRTDCRRKKVPRFVVFGDSHARLITQVLRTLVPDCAASTELHRLGQYPVLSEEELTEGSSTADPETALAQALDRQQRFESAVRRLRDGDVLVLASRLACRLYASCFSVQLTTRRSVFFDEVGRMVDEKQAQDRYFDQVRLLALRLAPRRVPVLIVLPMPEIRRHPSLCRPEWFRPIRASECGAAKEWLERRAEIVRRLQALADSPEGSNLVLFDPFDALCGDEQCSRVHQEPELMRDATHVVADDEALAASLAETLIANQLGHERKVKPKKGGKGKGKGKGKRRVDEAR